MQRLISLEKAVVLVKLEEQRRRGWPQGSKDDDVLSFSESLEDLKGHVRVRLLW